MPDATTIKKARKDKSEGKAASTQAGEFVHEEIEHVKEGKHGARSAKQAIAIGLSKARRAGVKLPAPKKGTASEATRHKAELDNEAGAEGARKSVSRTRSAATGEALKHEGHAAASARGALPAGEDGGRAAHRRRALGRGAPGGATKGAEERSAAAKKAAETRAQEAPAKKSPAKKTAAKKSPARKPAAKKSS